MQIFGQQSSECRNGRPLGREDGAQRHALHIGVVVFTPAEAKEDAAEHLPGRHMQRINFHESSRMPRCRSRVEAGMARHFGLAASTSSDQLPESQKPTIGRKLSDSRTS